MTLALSRSRSTQDHHLNKLCRAWVPEAVYQVSRPLACWFQRRRFLKGFYHMWAWWPSWSYDQNHLNKLLFPYPMEAPYEIWLWLAQWFLRRRCLKSVDDGRRWRMDDRACPYYKLTHELKGSHELKIKDCYKLKVNCFEQKHQHLSQNSTGTAITFNYPDRIDRIL